MVDWSNIQYFEINFSKIKMPDFREAILLDIKDITAAIQKQQKKSDELYQDAIEANFSHEQMNPLNNILQNASTVHAIMNRQLAENPGSKDALNSMKLVKAIGQSGQIMWYFNQNQIQRMKIKKRQYAAKQTQIQCLRQLIKKVVSPFETQLNQIQAKVLVSLRIPDDLVLRTDWSSFELILFNFIQNAVKYNTSQGLVVIVADFEPDPSSALLQTEEKTAMLRVQVVDTGVGIEKNRQNLLFKPFLELKQKQSMQLVKDNSIGLGLACSQVLCSHLKGSVQLLTSRKRLTVFQFKLPIKWTKAAERQSQPKIKISPPAQEVSQQHFPELKTYLGQKGIQTLEEMEFEQANDQIP